MHTAEELSKTIVDIVTMPDIYMHVQSVIDDPNSGLPEVAEVIQNDPGITARLLKLANSPLFNFSARVDTVTRAVNLLGAQEIHDLVLTTCVTRAFGNVAEHRAIDMRDFWSNSVLCANLSCRLAEKSNHFNSKHYFVLGLLHDIGHLVMYQMVPDECQSALVQSYQSGEPLHLVERDLIGCCYAEVGGALLSRWNMPESICRSARWHVEPDQGGDFTMEASIVHIASQLSRATSFDILIDDASLEFSEFAWETTGLDREECAEIRDEAEETVSELLAMIQPKQMAA